MATRLDQVEKGVAALNVRVTRVELAMSESSFIELVTVLKTISATLTNIHQAIESISSGGITQAQIDEQAARIRANREKIEEAKK